MRISELEYVTIERIKQGYIEVYNKGGSRLIPIPSDLSRDILKYCKDIGITTGIVIRTRNNKRVHRTVILRSMQKLALLLNMKKSKVHPHSFRHTFARDYLEKECGTIVTLAAILGHRNITTTMVYIKNTLSDTSKTMTLNKLGIKIAL